MMSLSSGRRPATEPVVAPSLPKTFLRSSLLLLLREHQAHGYELL